MGSILWLLVQILTIFRVVNSQIPDFTPEMEEQITSVIEATMACRDIPGLIFSVVHKGEVAMQRAFGVTDVDTMEPVTEDTIFGIGSVTKSFTTNLLAVLLSESDGLYNWDTPLREIFGTNFTLTDDIRTEYVTIRDIISHKVNLYTYITTIFTNYPFERQSLELCSRLNHLEAASGFRQEFIYDNMMYFLAGCVAEVIGGQPYSELLRSRILEPLNMTSSLLTSEVLDFSEVPTAYIWSARDQEKLVVDKRLLYVEPLDPAGALLSTTGDMTNYMIAQLNGGSFGGEEVIPFEFWQDTQLPSNVQNELFLGYSKPLFPFHWQAPTYGFGWFLGTYQGYNQVYHTGGIAGFLTILVLYPDTQSAIFLSTNHVGNDSIGLITQTPIFFTSDLLMGEEPVLNETTSCTFPEPWVELPEVVEISRTLVNIDQPQPQPISEVEANAEEPGWELNDWIIENYELFVGDYGHSLFGNFSIGFNETLARLTFTQGRIGEGSLIPINVEDPIEEKNFLMEFEGALYNTFRALGLRFQPLYFQNLQGEYQEIVAVGYEPAAPPVFVRGLEW